MLHGAAHTVENGGALIIGKLGHGLPFYGVGETQQHRIPVGRLGYAKTLRGCHNLSLIGRHRLHVELHGALVADILHIHRKLGLAALKASGGDGPHIRLYGAIARRHTHRQIQLFGVKRLYLKCKFLVIEFDNGAAETCH